MKRMRSSEDCGTSAPGFTLADERECFAKWRSTPLVVMRAMWEPFYRLRKGGKDGVSTGSAVGSFSSRFSVLSSRFSVLGSQVHVAGLELTSLIIIIVAGLRGEDCVPRGRHGGVAFDVAPQNTVKQRGVYGVGSREIHLCGLRTAGGFAGIHLVDQAVVAIAPVGGEWRLRAGAGEERGHDRGVGVVLVHGREAEYGFHGVHHVYRRVEAAVDNRVLGGS